MPAPNIIPVSSSVLNVTWRKPELEESRGEVTKYVVWLYKEMNLTVNPYGPHYTWTVSNSLL